MARRGEVRCASSRTSRPKKEWVKAANASVKAGKSHPNTNQANLLVGDWHWFLSHDIHYLGRVNARTGTVEYLELPAQLRRLSASSLGLLLGPHRRFPSLGHGLY